MPRRSTPRCRRTCQATGMCRAGYTTAGRWARRTVRRSIRRSIHTIARRRHPGGMRHGGSHTMAVSNRGRRSHHRTHSDRLRCTGREPSSHWGKWATRMRRRSTQRRSCTWRRPHPPPCTVRAPSSCEGSWAASTRAQPIRYDTRTRQGRHTRRGVSARRIRRPGTQARSSVGPSTRHGIHTCVMRRWPRCGRVHAGIL